MNLINLIYSPAIVFHVFTTFCCNALCYADTPRGWRIRIRYVSDTDTPRIHLGYVSSRILKMQIRFVLDTCIRHVWARLDTAQSTSHPN